MANKRPKPEEIVSKLRQVEALMGQAAKIQIRIAVLNRYTALGIPITEPVG
ncbi:hypothetical protein [Ruegeria atlantica]|uniref:Transposase n=1 Tax=Ruegeria atlantica TaxID=81569 RepID=A0A0P1EL09_9RHOB|nr:hypothetical protein [Ruegeria atlantica]CUH42238.1 hypothetical protein RUM4293_01126 [Ruegeria atlantica]